MAGVRVVFFLTIMYRQAVGLITVHRAIIHFTVHLVVDSASSARDRDVSSPKKGKGKRKSWRRGVTVSSIGLINFNSIIYLFRITDITQCDNKDMNSEQDTPGS